MKRIFAREFLLFLGILLVTILLGKTMGNLTNEDLVELWNRSTPQRIGDGFIIIRTLAVAGWFVTKPLLIYFTYAFIRITIWAINTLTKK
jgi:uncharacterized protein HemY